MKLIDKIVYVWWVDLNKVKQYQADFRQWLADSEIQRAERFLRPEHRERYIAVHAILRLLLAKYLAADPEDLVFTKGSRGKPYVAGINAGKLQFNLSDSENLALFAFTQKQEVGVDVEYIAEKIEALEIAERFFSPDEYQALLRCDPIQRKEKFYRCWVRKEAYLKLIGQGLHFPLSQFAVSIEDLPNCLLSVRGDVQLAQTCVVRSIDMHQVKMGNHYAAAFAVEGELEEIVFAEWEIQEESLAKAPRHER